MSIRTAICRIVNSIRNLTVKNTFPVPIKNRGRGCMKAGLRNPAFMQPLPIEHY